MWIIVVCYHMFLLQLFLSIAMAFLHYFCNENRLSMWMKHNTSRTRAFFENPGTKTERCLAMTQSYLTAKKKLFHKAVPDYGGVRAAHKPWWENARLFRQLVSPGKDVQVRKSLLSLSSLTNHHKPRFCKYFPICFETKSTHAVKWFTHL